MAIDQGRLNEIREGRRGLALALYIDIDDEEWDDYCSSISSVLALDEMTGRRVLEAMRDGLESGHALEVSDDASDAVSIVLASTLKDQVLIARMSDGLAGHADEMVSRESWSTA